MTTAETAQLMQEMNALLHHFKTTAETIARESLENTRRLEQALKETKAEMAQLRQEIIREMSIQTKKAIKEALDEQAKEFEKRLKFATDDVTDMVRLLFKERKETAAQTRILSWKGVIGVGAAMAAMVIGTGVYVGNKHEELQKINAETKDARYNAHAKELLNKLEVKQCDGRPCVATDPDASGYGDRGKYRVLAE